MSVVGIGTTNPTETLDVDGNVRMRTGSSLGYIAVSDSNGVMNWTDPMTINALQGIQGVAGVDGIDGAAGIDGVNGTNGGSGVTYLAKVNFNVAEDIEDITMIDPAGDGTFTTSGVTTGISSGGNGERFAEFTFGQETSACTNITILAADMVLNTYRVTSVNGGGDNKSYLMTNVNMTQVGTTNNYDGDIWTAFSNTTIKLDLTISNIDYVRRGFPTKEAHAYIIFKF